MSLMGVPSGAQPAYGIGGMLGMQPVQPQAIQPPAAGMSTLPSMAPTAPGTSAGVVGDTMAGARAIGSALKESAPVRTILTGLRSLGLYKGSIEKPKDADVRTSILAFQRANNIPQTGALDAATVSAIETSKKKQVASEQARAAKSKKPSKRMTPAERKAAAKRAKRLAAKRAAAEKAAAAKVAVAPAAMQPSPTGVTSGIQGATAMSGSGMAAPGQSAATLGLPLGSMGTFGVPNTGLGAVGLSGMGFPSPAATGATGPQLNATNQQGLSNVPNGATQHVTNRNTYDSSAQSGLDTGMYGMPFGLGGFGGLGGYGGFGGIGGFGLGSGYGLGTYPYGAGLVGWQGAGLLS